MYALTRNGSAAGTAADMRALPAATVPLIVAKALTFTAQKAQAAIVQAMSSVFQGGATRYTLSSTRIQPASVDMLQARVAVKDRTATAGNVPENYLAPEVFGGPRKEKRYERALRYAGLLRGGERAVPGAAADLDAFGNFSVTRIRTLLQQAGAITRSAQGQARLRRARGRKQASLLIGKPAGGNRPAGIWQREGSTRAGARRLRPLLVFVTKAPMFSARFDFSGIAEATARAEFQPTFERLLRAGTKAR